VRLYEISAHGQPKEWINLDLVTRVGFYTNARSNAPELELRLAGGGAPAPITDVAKIKELGELLEIELPIS
jgi:hypothetical protein